MKYRKKITSASATELVYFLTLLSEQMGHRPGKAQEVIINNLFRNRSELLWFSG